MIELIKPNSNKEPDFTTGKTDNKKLYEFDCTECGMGLKIEFEQFINNCWNGKTSNVSQNEYDELREFYHIGRSNKSHDGGFAVFDKISCSKCKTEYFILAGISEFSNSAFTVQIQGILRKDHPYI